MHEAQCPGLDYLDAVRERLQTITGRFAGFQAQWLNVHVDFPLLQRLGLPITIGAVRYPGIKIHDPRVIRLLEVLLHGGSQVGGWTAKHIHHAVFTTFHLLAEPTPLGPAQAQSPRAAANKTALAMVFKLVEGAQKSWRRIDGHNQLPKLIQGVKFADGIEVIGNSTVYQAQAAA
jgi:hypothetical protein